MSESEIAQKVLSGLKWSAIVRVIGQIINWSMTILVIRYVKPEEYGLKSLAEIFMGIFMILSSGGLESAIIHAKELSADKIRKAFGLLIVINLTLFVAQVIAAYPIAEYYQEPRVAILIQVMAIGFLLIPFGVIPSALLNHKLEYKKVASISLFANTLGSVCTLMLALLGWGVWSLIIGPLVGSLLSVILLNVYRPCLGFPKFSLNGMSEMALFGGTIISTSLLWIVFSKADIFIAGRFVNAHEIGIYAVALHLASLPIDKIVPVLNQVAFPAYSRLRDNPEVIAKYFLKVIRLTSLVLFPLSFGLVGISQHLIPAVFGEQWNGVLPILLVLGLVFPLRGISSLCAPMTNAIGAPNIQLKLVFMANLIMIPGFMIGVKYGVIGLVSVWLFVYPWIMLSNLLASIRQIKLTFRCFLRAIIPPIFVASIMLIFLLYFSARNTIILNQWVGIGVMVFFGAIIYLLGMFILSKNRIYELIDFLWGKN